jgi:hypothetical protein
MYLANSYVIRQATDADAPTLRHLAELDSQNPTPLLGDRRRAAFRPFVRDASKG